MGRGGRTHLEKGLGDGLGAAVRSAARFGEVWARGRVASVVGEGPTTDEPMVRQLLTLRLQLGECGMGRGQGLNWGQQLACQACSKVARARASNEGAVSKVARGHQGGWGGIPLRSKRGQTRSKLVKTRADQSC